MLDAWDTDTYLGQNIHGNHALLSTFLRKYDLQILASLQEEERNYDGDNEEHYMQIHTTQYHSILTTIKKDTDNMRRIMDWIASKNFKSFSLSIDKKF